MDRFFIVTEVNISNKTCHLVVTLSLFSFVIIANKQMGHCLIIRLKSFKTDIKKTDPNYRLLLEMEVDVHNDLID